MSGPILSRHDRNDLLTHAECVEILNNVLGNSKSGKLLNFSIVPELGTIGYLGEYFHLQLSYEVDNDDAVHDTRLFIKSMPFQNANMSLFIEKSGILKKEATLYETLLNELRKISKSTWCAQCYFTKKDLFVMQNIEDLGYAPLKDATGFLQPLQIKAILKGLAILHASSIAYEVRNNVNIGVELKDVLYEVTVSPTVDWYTAGIRAVIAVALKHPAYQSSEIQEILETKLQPHIDLVYEMVNPSTKYRNVFCHRDPWGGNVFFSKSNPNEVPSVFVDFQLCRYSPAAIDVLMAIYLNIKPSDRKPIMKQFCQHYYNCFAAELNEMGIDANEHMSLLDFEKSIADLELYGALINSICATILRVPGDYLHEMKLNRPVDFHRYTNVDRTKEVLNLIATHDEFREYIFDCIEDLMKLILPKNKN